MFCILFWFMFRADCVCSMVELVGAAHVLHDSRCVQVLFVANSQDYAGKVVEELQKAVVVIGGNYGESLRQLDIVMMLT